MSYSRCSRDFYFCPYVSCFLAAAITKPHVCLTFVFWGLSALFQYSESNQPLQMVNLSEIASIEGFFLFFHAPLLPYIFFQNGDHAYKLNPLGMYLGCYTFKTIWPYWTYLDCNEFNSSIYRSSICFFLYLFEVNLRCKLPLKFVLRPTSLIFFLFCL